MRQAIVAASLCALLLVVPGCMQDQAPAAPAPTAQAPPHSPPPAPTVKPTSRWPGRGEFTQTSYEPWLVESRGCNGCDPGVSNRLVTVYRDGGILVSDYVPRPDGKPGLNFTARGDEVYRSILDTLLASAQVLGSRTASNATVGLQVSKVTTGTLSENDWNKVSSLFVEHLRDPKAPELGSCTDCVQVRIESFGAPFQTSIQRNSNADLGPDWGLLAQQVEILNRWVGS